MCSKNIKDFSPKQLEDYFCKIGEKPYRSKQISKWIYQKNADSYDSMTDLSIGLRERLQSDLQLSSSLSLVNEQKSKDETIKYLFELHDEKRIETVLIPDSKRLTLCVSSQVGCALGCTFCLTGVVGKIRNLRPSEIVDQFLFVSSKINKSITNIVFMGMGEPLDNLENLITALEILTDKNFVGMSSRRITVSTSGLANRIKELGKRISINLSISLNASNDELRNELMPINKRFPIKQLIDSTKNFPFPSRKLLTFEYVLLKGVNDFDKNAYELTDLLKRLRCKINLIPCNESFPLPYKTPSKDRILSFQQILISSGINAKIRKNRGRDILGACGQLAARYPVSENSSTVSVN